MTNPAAASRRRITLERNYQAPVDDVWDLWTTKDGIESWWGPEGFSVEVHAINVRPGGELRYAMSATGPDQMAFMKRAGMPLTSEHCLTYVETARHGRLSYTMLADFIPGVDTYEVATTVAFFPDAQGVRITVTFDAMHDDHWTEMSKMGRESELDRLEQVLKLKRAR